jgi:hypothetical protein
LVRKNDGSVDAVSAQPPVEFCRSEDIVGAGENFAQVFFLSDRFGVHRMPETRPYGCHPTDLRALSLENDRWLQGECVVDENRFEGGQKGFTLLSSEPGIFGHHAKTRGAHAHSKSMEQGQYSIVNTVQDHPGWVYPYLE